WIRPGRITEISVIGFVLLLAAIIGGGWVAGTEWGAALFTLDRTTIAWAVIIYGFVAAVLPVWLLLAPRDYLSTFMKIGVIAGLAL
ncbi:carbon starvation protein A, partial [Salmonella enterica subsp. enterica serovar Typhimurium]